MPLLPPGLILIAGALLVPFLRGWVRSAYMLALPAVGLADLLAAGTGNFHAFTLSGYAMAPVRIDALSLAFGIVFHAAAFVAVIYALHVKDAVQHAAALVYAGAAIGGVFAGDLITLFVYWELTAIASVFLIWASRTDRAYRAGLRYLIVQVGSGVLLLAGAVVHLNATGSVAFERMTLDALGPALIFLAIGVKCAFPFLHNWLADAYPEATPSGTVFLSAFTTKLAVYALARGFPGTEWLVPIGAVMAVFPMFYALLENDLRRVLAYTLNAKLGFMVVGVGVGTPLALNGVAASAAASVAYQALSFMAIGAVLHRTGTAKASDLGGLARAMPWTTAFCVLGALTLVATPLTIGFIGKAMILSAVQDKVLLGAWYALLFSSAGAVAFAGIKVPYFAFFGAPPPRGPVKEAPVNMLVAMAVAAAACLALGIAPGFLYAILPYYPVDYAPYTATHIVTQFQLLVLAALAVAVLLRVGLYPTPGHAVYLDFDWTYRTALPWAARTFVRHGGAVWLAATRQCLARLDRMTERLYRHHGPEGVFARTWPTGATVLWVAVMLAAYLVIYNV